MSSLLLEASPSATLLGEPALMEPQEEEEGIAFDTEVRPRNPTKRKDSQPKAMHAISKPIGRDDDLPIWEQWQIPEDVSAVREEMLELRKEVERLHATSA